MITPDNLTLLSNMPAAMLTMGIRENYPEDQFTAAKFKGLNSDGHFCYECTYKNSDGELETCQVYVRYDHTKDKVSIDY